MKLQKVIFLKSQKLLTENLHGGSLFRTFNSYSFTMSMAGYVTAVLAFVRAELCGRETSIFCDFWQVTYNCDFTPFYLIIWLAY